MWWAHRRHGAAVFCVRKGDVLDVVGSDARNLRAAKGRKDRISVFNEIMCRALLLVSDEYVVVGYVCRWCLRLSRMQRRKISARVPPGYVMHLQHNTHKHQLH
jgi:hypothetical protein